MIQNNDPPSPEHGHHNDNEGIAMWRIDKSSTTTSPGYFIEDEEQVQLNNDNNRMSRGLFRKFSLKVIEWIRKSLELGRNEVCLCVP